MDGKQSISYIIILKRLLGSPSFEDLYAFALSKKMPTFMLEMNVKFPHMIGPENVKIIKSLR